MTITIVGLGPGHPDLLTRRAWQTLEPASEVYLRTAQHPGVEALPIRHLKSFDAWYEEAADFDALYSRIAEEIIRLGGGGNSVVYAVPGHPLVGEHTVTLILERAKAADIPVILVDGLGFIEPTLAVLGIDALDGLQLHDAVDIARMHHPPLNPDVPALLAQVYSHTVASNVKLTLANQYPDDHEVVLVHGAGTAGASLERLPLHEIDHSEQINHLTSLYVPPLMAKGSFEYFQEIVAHLRAPEGCPWDQKQTHESLRPYLLEETYEVLEALDHENTTELAKELGDLLLQIVLHTQIATEAGEFQMGDVLAHISQKMIRRHPHVWGDVKVRDADHVVDNWQENKRKERLASGDQPKSALEGIPETLPALAYAATMHDRAARLGFEWETVEQVIAKLHEEVAEVLSADADHRAEELGDVFSVLVNLARWWGLDPESVMRENNQKFSRRFRGVEALAGDRPLEGMTLAALDDLWNEVKRREKNSAKD
ncbi:MAG TPA: nucleoside triphosphate pyrophosphohydrolase [Aggregatilineales bacterium]|nr:nucleoside triphosphate pyrophosphohydrolase [Anaerolineales bacterium]HRE47636.1 nucleoside triphosphate pyrophosphohydrolase [Aggregatilineales bacterium]